MDVSTLYCQVIALFEDRTHPRFAYIYDMWINPCNVISIDTNHDQDHARITMANGHIEIIDDCYIHVLWRLVTGYESGTAYERPPIQGEVNPGDMQYDEDRFATIGNCKIKPMNVTHIKKLEALNLRNGSLVYVRDETDPYVVEGTPDEIVKQLWNC